LFYSSRRLSLWLKTASKSVHLPLTGPNAAYGQEEKRGVDMPLKE